MVNNFEKFRITDLKKGEFIFVQILQRSKDNPQIGANNRLIKYYCIESEEQLMSKKEDIITLCESLNARAYIHYTPRSYEAVHKEMIYDLANRLRASQSDRGLRNCFSSACGKSYVKSKKTWVVDIDEKNVDLDKICEDINGFMGQGEHIISILPTKSGYHLITHPFDLSQFSRWYPNIDVHKNNPTILYIK